jgi:hypothetical protein
MRLVLRLFVLVLLVVVVPVVLVMSRSSRSGRCGAGDRKQQCDAQIAASFWIAGA